MDDIVGSLSSFFCQKVRVNLYIPQVSKIVCFFTLMKDCQRNLITNSWIGTIRNTNGLFLYAIHTTGYFYIPFSAIPITINAHWQQVIDKVIHYVTCCAMCRTDNYSRSMIVYIRINTWRQTYSPAHTNSHLDTYQTHDITLPLRGRTTPCPLCWTFQLVLTTIVPTLIFKSLSVHCHKKSYVSFHSSSITVSSNCVSTSPMKSCNSSSIITCLSLSKRSIRKRVSSGSLLTSEWISSRVLS